MRRPLTAILQSVSASRETKAKRVVEKIKSSRGYSWVGLYDVHEREISLLCYSGNIKPMHQNLPKTAGLNGKAVLTKDIVLVNDTSKEPFYLPTFSDTRSEVVVPIFSYEANKVIGTLKVESHFSNAFDEEDIYFLEECAMMLSVLWEEEPALVRVRA